MPDISFIFIAASDIIMPESNPDNHTECTSLSNFKQLLYAILGLFNWSTNKQKYSNNGSIKKG